ncbi:MAG: hypothetical protein ACE5LS_02145 [Thermoplasmata archaeon]
MNTRSLHRILRSLGWIFGGGAGMLVAAPVLVVYDKGLLFLSLVLVVGGALIWTTFATAVLTLLVELAEAPRRTAAARE